MLGQVIAPEGAAVRQLDQLETLLVDVGRGTAGVVEPVEDPKLERHWLAL